MKFGKLNFLEPDGPLQACNGTALPLHLSLYSAGPIISLSGRSTVSDYVDVLVSKVPRMAQVLFPNDDAVFQDGNSATHTQPEVFNLGLRSTKMHFNIFPGQHSRQT
jgi:hypothetical protein